MATKISISSSRDHFSPGNSLLGKDPMIAIGQRVISHGTCARAVATERTATKLVLRIDASMRIEESASRALRDRLIDGPALIEIITRDLAADPLPQIDDTWIAGNFTAPEDREAGHRQRLALSERLIAKVEVVAIGLPV
jgi:hypothetical protein